MAQALPLLALPVQGPLDPGSLFSRPLDAFVLEVGFGSGEHLAARAHRRPALGFLGCEPFINGVAALLTRIEEEKHANIRLHHGDARDVLERLPDGALAEIHVLYPDPWPKKRHWKRRFIGPETLPNLARTLKPGGLLRVASDIPGYIRWTLLQVMRQGGFSWTAERPTDWRTPPADWPGTRYEAKALREGRVPTYLDFRRDEQHARP